MLQSDPMSNDNEHHHDDDSDHEQYFKQYFKQGTAGSSERTRLIIVTILIFSIRFL